MTIIAGVEPKGGRDIVHAALRARLSRAAHMPSLDGAPQTGAPLPLYRISAAAAAGTQPLARARRIGWQYPLLGGKRPGLVNLFRQGNRLRYAGVVEGAFPEAFLRAAMVADREFQDDAGTYEPRLLHVPSVQLHALWLFRARGGSRFISLSERQRAVPLRVEDNIRDMIRRAKDGGVPAVRAGAGQPRRKKGNVQNVKRIPTKKTSQR